MIEKLDVINLIINLVRLKSKLLLSVIKLCNVTLLFYILQVNKFIYKKI
jgi:hypothetical protein